MKTYYKSVVALSIFTLFTAAPSWATAIAANPLPVTQASIQLDEVTKRVVEKMKQTMPILREFVVKDIWKGKQTERVRFTKPKSAVTAVLYFNWQTGEVYGCDINDPSPTTAKNPFSDQAALQKAKDFLQKLKAITPVDLTQAKAAEIKPFANLITITYPSAKQENTNYLILEIDHKGQVIHFQKAGTELIDQLSPAEFDNVAKKTVEKVSGIFPGFKSATKDYVIKGLIDYDPVDTWKVQASSGSGNEKTIYMIQFDSKTGEIYEAYQGIDPTDTATSLTSVQAIAKGKKLLEQFYGTEAKVYQVKQTQQNTKITSPKQVHTKIVFEAPSLHKTVTIQLYKDGQIQSLEKKIPLS